MYFGQHPLPGFIEEDIEVGASVVASQVPRGGRRSPVLSIRIPKTCSKAKPKVLWGYFDGPQQLTYGVIRGIVPTSSRTAARRLA